MEYDKCLTNANTNLFKTREECNFALGEAYSFYEKRDFVIVSYHCYKWNTTEFDQES
jgi:hypothetical protein